MSKNSTKLSSEFSLRSSVAKILREVRARGDAAVSFFTKKYDDVSLEPKDFKVKKEVIFSSANRISNEVRKAIDRAAERVRFFAEKQMEVEYKPFWRTRNPDGILVGETMSPVSCAALYIPGGRFPYPSSVLMTAIPAVVSGVKRIYILTPPAGASCDEVLYAAYVSGVFEIYRVGGVQAIGAAAYGTKTIPKADIIVGPGNKYVAEAKRQVFGAVGIDMIAGPSEVAIIADDKASADWVAADISAQAEHDPDAVCWLLTASGKIIRDVLKILPDKYRRQMRVKKVSSILEACRIVSDEIAPEHLELMVSNAARYIKKIRNVGAIFAGYYAPTALGDYCAGPSHVLPTSGAARFSGGLSVKTFLKKTSFIVADGQRPSWIPVASTLASCEGLDMHRLSAELRRKKTKSK